MEGGHYSVTKLQKEKVRLAVRPTGPKTLKFLALTHGLCGASYQLLNSPVAIYETRWKVGTQFFQGYPGVRSQLLQGREGVIGM